MIARVRSVAPAVAWACAAALALAAALPAVWWEPLHLDERVMLEYAPRSPASIVREIFVERGGAPAQFLVEHVTLLWPGGVEGLRLPSLAFFLLALAWAGPVARGLVGQTEAVVVPVLLAVAPLAIGLATFARMYSLLLWLVLVAAWLALRAGRSGARRDWVVAGALAGGLVYVHPIAPLFAAPAFACGLASSTLPIRTAAPAALPGAVAAVVVALPYAYVLAVLSSRYGVGESGPIGTTAGRSVPEEALHALTPAGTPGLLVVAALAVAGAVRLYRLQPRTLAVIAAWIVLPVAFFTLVPAETRFFGRYVAAALPPLLVLVVAGCVALSFGRRLVLVALVGVVAGLGAVENADRLRTLSSLDLDALPAPGSAGVLFSSTGTPRSDRPPELLDDLVALEHDGVPRLEELPAIDPRYEDGLAAKGERNVRAFLAAPGAAGGMWLFRGRPTRVAAAVGRLDGDPDLTSRRIGDELLVVGTRRPAPRRRLVELGIRARSAWGLDTPADRWPRLLAIIDRAALG
jgi:hypothetical protein